MDQGSVFSLASGRFRVHASPPPLDLAGSPLGAPRLVLTTVGPGPCTVDAATGELVPLPPRPPRPAKPAKPAGGAKPAGRLGKPTKLSTPPLRGGGVAKAVLQAKQALSYPADASAARVERFALQAAVRDVLPASRSARCFRSLTSGARDVPVVHSAATGRASYRNLQVCARVWNCPVCAARITEQRRLELVRAVERHRASGGFVYLATRTFSHGPAQSVTELMAGFGLAEKRFKSGAPYKRLRARFGVVGTIRSVEITYGDNGWHPHVHELIFTRAPVDAVALRDALFERWHSACERAGLGLPTREHGVDVRDGAYAAKYAAKWGMESELTKWHVKRGKASLSPFDLLRVVVQSSDERATAQARALFREYADAFHGKRQLVWSPGLEHLLDEDVSDEEIADAVDPESTVLGLLSLAGWRHVLTRGIRGELLEVASRGGWPAVVQLLGADADSLTLPVDGRTAVHRGQLPPAPSPQPDRGQVYRALDRARGRV